MNTTAEIALAEALAKVESAHGFNGTWCLCGYETGIPLNQTRHIMEAILEGTIETIAEATMEASYPLVAEFKAEHTTEWAVQDAAGQHPHGPTTTSESDRDEMLAQIAEAKTLGLDAVLIHRTVGRWKRTEP